MASLAAPLAVQAQTLPKTMRIIVPYPAGGAGDVLARVVANYISEKTGSTIIVEDRPGAASVVGTEAAARAAADGATILLVENPYVLSAVLRPTTVHYDPVKTFDPLCYVGDTPAVMAVNARSDIKTFDDLVKKAKAKENLSYGSTGPASIVHIAGEMMKKQSGLDMTYVPFPGSPPAVNAVLSNTITAVIANYSDLQSQLTAGNLRAIVIPASKRVQTLPDVPAASEVGFRDVEAAVWFGFVLPKGVPKDIADELNKQFAAAMEVPSVVEKVKQQGLFPAVSCGAPFGQFLADQHKKYVEFVKEFDIKGE
jgi:tripartite-type tricarboxylate transporter receptor subunit TctC